MKSKGKEKASTFRKISAKLFLNYVNKNKKSYRNLKKDYVHSRINTLFEIYLSTVYFSVFLAFILSLVTVFIFLQLLGYPLLHSFFFSIFASMISAMVIFIIMYLYPRNKSDARKESIEINLPFAIIYLSGIASSGVPPQNMFKLLSEAKGFGEVSKEAKYLVYLIERRNYGLLNALNVCANRTPSNSFKEFLLSVIMTIKYGGDLESFLKTEASRKEIDYRLKAKEYQEKLSMYSTMYSGLFIAAPVLFVSMFSLMNFFSSFGGADILEQIVLFGLPLVNTMFLYYLHISQPNI